MKNRVSTLGVFVVIATACGGKASPPLATPPPATAAARPAAAASPTAAPAGQLCVAVGGSSKVEKCGSDCYVHTHTFSTTIKDKKFEWQGQTRGEGSRGWYNTNGYGCCPVTCEDLERGEKPPCKVRTVYGDQAITVASEPLEEYRRVYCPPCGGCEAMLKPNPDAAKLFDSLYVGPADPSVPLTASDKLAISRFRDNCVAARLLNDLASMPCPPDWEAPPTCTMGSYIRFNLRFQDYVPGSDVEAGSVAVGPEPATLYPNPAASDPDLLKRFVYTVSVTRQADTPADYGHAFPAPDDPCFTYTFSEGTSAMAKTIYHELLHIWWMNKNQTDYYNSGHEPDITKCGSYQPEFVRRLHDFYRAMDELEKCRKRSPNP